MKKNERKRNTKKKKGKVVINSWSAASSLQWCRNERAGVSITSLTIVYSTVYWKHRSKKILKLCATGLCEGNSSVTGEFPAQRASDTENVSIWWQHHVLWNLFSHFEWHSQVEKCHTNDGIISNVLVSIKPEHLVPVGAWASAGTVMTKFWKCISKCDLQNIFCSSLNMLFHLNKFLQ